ncbi:unnamed protein product [Prunus armeniaca]
MQSVRGWGGGMVMRWVLGWRSWLLRSKGLKLLEGAARNEKKIYEKQRLLDYEKSIICITKNRPRLPGRPIIKHTSISKGAYYSQWRIPYRILVWIRYASDTVRYALDTYRSQRIRQLTNGYEYPTFQTRVSDFSDTNLRAKFAVEEPLGAACEEEGRGKKKKKMSDWREVEREGEREKKKMSDCRGRETERQRGREEEDVRLISSDDVVC